MISKLKGHSIVCGTTPMAIATIERLVRKRKDVVVIDDNKEELQEIRRRFKRVYVVEGKPTNELQLAEANVLSAANVVAALHDEVDREPGSVRRRRLHLGERPEGVRH